MSEFYLFMQRLSKLNDKVFLKFDTINRLNKI